jgi:antagonist of KipI
LRLVGGRQWEQFTEDSRARFLSGTFSVAMNSDRMGLRLEGEEISIAKTGELPSEPIVPGAIQIPRNGAPIILLGDGQTIGGYPKIAHVITVDLARAAQLQPLDQVRFELIALAEARDLLLKRERDIALFRVGLQTRFA